MNEPDANRDSDRQVAAEMLRAAADVARSLHARALLAYLDAVVDVDALRNLDAGQADLILVVRDRTGAQVASALGFHSITVPPVTLTRMGQIKTATLIAFLAGPAHRRLDTIVVMSVGDEWEMFQTVDQPRLTEHIKRAVFERVLRIALELAAEGREGKAVGALFVLGDHHNVDEYCQQIILNPFKGYLEAERNVLDENVRETVKSYATLDGAFILKGNGVIISAGTYLKGLKTGSPLQQGLAARHAAAAGITASTHCIAVTVSQSTGTVRVWRRGQMITEIEKPPHASGDGTLSDVD